MNFVLREGFAFLFETFSRNDLPGEKKINEIWRNFAKQIAKNLPRDRFLRYGRTLATETAGFGGIRHVLRAASDDRNRLQQRKETIPNQGSRVLIVFWQIWQISRKFQIDDVSGFKMF